MKKSDVIPPILLPALQAMLGRQYGYVGNYPTWEAAVAAAGKGGVYDGFHRLQGHD